MNNPHTPTCTSRGGRPVTTGTPPTRAAGRHGPIWDVWAARAKADGQPMSEFIAEALSREYDRRVRADARAAKAGQP